MARVEILGANWYDTSMSRYVALLRGINVGGKNLIKMPALKACFEANGFEDVATYIQSGNVLFSSTGARPAELTPRIEAMLAETFGYEATVVVRSRTQMRAVVGRAPKGFGGAPADVPVRRDLPEGAAHRESRDDERAHEARRRRGARGDRGALLLEAHEKATQSRLSRIVSSPIYPNVTIRNWNTTTKLERMVDGSA